MKTTKPIDMVIFDAVLLAAFVTFAIVGASYQPMARELPLPISIIGAALVLFLFLSDVFPAVHRALPFVNRSGVGGSAYNTAEVAQQDGQPTREGMSGADWIRIIRLVLWMVALIVAMHYIGYLAATGCFVFLLTWVEGRLKWWHALISAIGTVIFFYIVFDLFLAVSL